MCDKQFVGHPLEYMLNFSFEIIVKLFSVVRLAQPMALVSILHMLNWSEETFNEHLPFISTAFHIHSQRQPSQRQAIIC